MAKSYLINQTTGDLDFTNIGINLINDGTEYRRQKLQTKLSLFINEWFLNINAGFDWFGFLEQKPFDYETFESDFKTYILDTEGIESFISYNSEIDSANRVLKIDFKVLDIDNNIINISEVFP